MQRVYVIYVDGRPKYYSYIAKFANQRAKELTQTGVACAVFGKPEPWIRNHQQVVLIQSESDDAADAGRVRHQKLQVTRQKIHELFGHAVPAKVSDTLAGIQVVFGFSQTTVTVTMDRSPPSLVGSLDRRLINAVMRRFGISNLEAMDGIRELAIWIADQWNELDLTETPW